MTCPSCGRPTATDDPAGACLCAHDSDQEAPYEPLRVWAVRETCISHPAQFTAQTAIGEEPRHVYVRYRHGRLLVAIGPAGGDEWSAVGSDEIWHQSEDGTNDGFLSWHEIERRTNVLNIGKEVIRMESG